MFLYMLAFLCEVVHTRDLGESCYSQVYLPKEIRDKSAAVLPAMRSAEAKQERAFADFPIQRQAAKSVGMYQDHSIFQKRNGNCRQTHRKKLSKKCSACNTFSSREDSNFGLKIALCCKSDTVVHLGLFGAIPSPVLGAAFHSAFIKRAHHCAKGTVAITTLN